QIDLTGGEHAHIRRRLTTDTAQESLVQALHALHSITESQSICVVVSLPGVVSLEGDVSLAPAFAATGKSGNLVQVLERATRLPVLVENDVNLLALGERSMGVAQDVDNFVLIYIGEGIGGALVLNRRIFRGASQSAGEIGFLPWEQNLPDHQSAIGPLESTWSSHGIARQALEMGLEVEADDVIGTLAAHDSDAARSILHAAVKAWAYAAIVNICVLNPELIVFAGNIDQVSASMRSELIEQVRISSPSPVHVDFASLGSAAITHGAIAQVAA